MKVGNTTLWWFLKSEFHFPFDSSFKKTKGFMGSQTLPVNCKKDKHIVLHCAGPLGSDLEFSYMERKKPAKPTQPKKRD